MLSVRNLIKFFSVFCCALLTLGFANYSFAGAPTGGYSLFTLPG